MVNTAMQAHKIIKARRLELGLSESVVASQCGISISAYGDVEQHADEFTTVLKISEAKRICDCLELNFFDLAKSEMDGVADVSEIPLEKSSMLRNELVLNRREELGISQAQLADVLGFDVDAIEQIEREPSYLESWSIELVVNLANALNLSPMVLL